MNRPLILPVLGIAVVLAIASLKIYGRVARPGVPLQVSTTVDHFAPGVAIGTTLGESRKKLYEMRWVQHLGFVGEINSDEFALIRLTPTSEARQKARADDRAILESVEFVSVKGDAFANTMSDLGIVFRSSPKDGCIVPGTEGMPHRRVQYWTTRSDRGGVALVSDWSLTPATSTADVAVWSMIAWAGPFKGSETLLAKFDPRSCLALVGV